MRSREELKLEGGGGRNTEISSDSSGDKRAAKRNEEK